MAVSAVRLLIVLNVLLAAGLLYRFLPDRTADAQLRRPSDYLMIPGEVVGASTSIVYVIDSTNGILGGMTYDDTAGELQTMPPVDLGRVFDSYVAQQPRRGR